MSLTAHRVTVLTTRGIESHLVVACPQRIEPVPIATCASCDLCGGLDLDAPEARVSVRCSVLPSGAGRESASPAGTSRAHLASIMASPVVSVRENAAVENVRWLMIERGIGAVPVVDVRGRPVGVLSKTDLLRADDDDTGVLDAVPRAVAHGELPVRAASGLEAEDVMTPVVHALPASASIFAAATLMASEKIHHVIVISEDDEQVVGIVSSMDLVRWTALRERFSR